MDNGKYHQETGTKKMENQLQNWTLRYFISIIDK